MDSSERNRKRSSDRNRRGTSNPIKQRGSVGKRVLILLAVIATLLAAAVIVVVTVTGSPDESRNSKSPSKTEKSKRDKDAISIGHAESAPKLNSRVVRDVKIPVLMYHVTADPPRNAPWPKLYVKRSVFKKQMQSLSINGYRGVTLDRVYEAWHGGRPLPKKPVVISFDDGYRSHFTNAFPVLKKLHWPGVLNLEINNLKQTWGINPKRVRALIAAGWEIDSHTITHPDLSTSDASVLKSEISDSRKIIKRRFGVPVNFFCYPAGRYDDATIAAVKSAGYRGATSTEHGLADPNDPFSLDRIRINGGEGAESPLNKIEALIPL